MATKYKVDLAGVIYQASMAETTQEDDDTIILLRVSPVDVFAKAQEALQKLYEVSSDPEIGE